jgi:hypothetical protein
LKVKILITLTLPSPIKGEGTIRQAQNEWQDYVISVLSRDKVGNFSGSDANRRIGSTIVNQELIP